MIYFYCVLQWLRNIWHIFLLFHAWNTFFSASGTHFAIFFPANQQFLLNLFSFALPCGLRMEYIKCCLWALYFSRLSLGGIIYFRVLKWQLNANYFNIMSSVLKMPSNYIIACLNTQISHKYFKLNVSDWNSWVSYPLHPNLNFPQNSIA